MGKDEARQAISRDLFDLQERFQACGTTKELDAACAWAGKVVCRASKEGLLPNCWADAAPNRKRDDVSEDQSLSWTMLFSSFAMFAAKDNRDSLPENPLAVEWEAMPGGQKGGTRKQDWKIRASNYAILCGKLAEDFSEAGEVESSYVDMSQMAAIVGVTKITIRRLYDKAELPEPDIKGGGGKGHKWRWNKVRGILEDKYSRELPELFPSLNFIR